MMESMSYVMLWGAYPVDKISSMLCTREGHSRRHEPPPYRNKPQPYRIEPPWLPDSTHLILVPVTLFIPKYKRRTERCGTEAKKGEVQCC